MRAILTILLVMLGCRERSQHEPRPSPSTATSTSTATASARLPALPATPDGDAELRSLDAQIARATDPAVLVPLVLERATIADRVEDFQAALDRTARWIEAEPTSAAAWRERARALIAVHRFADARSAIDKLRTFDRDPSVADDFAATVDEATGQHARVTAFRERRAREHATPINLVAWANHLAMAGRVDDALAIMPDAARAIRHNPARLVGWLLFQWARLLEQTGELAAARAFYEASHSRFPGALATAVQLVRTTRATGGDATAERVRVALDRFGPHPELLDLAGRIGDARAAWERRVAALPEAYADHAARFFVGAGRDPQRGLALARVNRAARDTVSARALVVEAALAANEPATACDVVDALTIGSRAQQFLAWQALSACGQAARAEQLAAALGITGSASIR